MSASTCNIVYDETVEEERYDELRIPHLVVLERRPMNENGSLALAMETFTVTGTLSVGF